jgi:ABC-2 type transport system permease protein
VRRLARSLAAEGRTVFVSSHLMSEMQLTADHLVVIGKGRLIADAPLAEVISATSGVAVRVRSPEAGGLAALGSRLRAQSMVVESDGPDALIVRNATTGQVGDVAHAKRRSRRPSWSSPTRASSSGCPQMATEPVVAELPVLSRPAADPAAGGGLRGAIACEWTKLRSVRSTWWCLIAGTALVVLHVLIEGLSARSSLAAGAPGAAVRSAGGVATGSVVFMQFAALALAVLATAGEYATGSIHSTLQWIPGRARFLAAKGAVVLPVLFCLGVLLGLLATVVAVRVMGEAALPLQAGAALRPILALGVYLGLTGVLAVGLATTLRSVAGTLVSIFLLVLVIPMALQNSAVAFLVRIGDLFPGSAGMYLAGTDASGPYGPPVAGMILAVWAAAAWLGGLGALRTRDA